ncbi:stress response translation initiation inhibitor YciH [Psychrobium sp. 1_MG-2023]|uniref:stress response translation initiation inhibitor YciH n=1 Tax=Psychrobium sp. 1_MG-2023 TaxID=3062624 RepID=UPI000C325591|nr:stress response translation initiation inhibitor YciH [Psychrobium sp. 1_MG-2023]MDP2562377.1 stress response translation initiation inhibitor YciH [Psychrobium sp. 1_MG-2023]PKF55857.1 stress response translation initiation inhibitor YciH [Alteromonadales bacterium alter-6D02]
MRHNEDSVLVFSTDSGRIKQEKPPAAVPTGDGIVRIKRETKGRKGKGVITVNGLLLEAAELKKLAKELKKVCGCGGAVKDGIIEIQGDQRESIKQFLEKKGFTVKLAGG